MKKNSIRAIITGTTGMVGEGVLHECLQHPDVAAVLVINRRPSGVSHPKLTEIIHDNFFDLSAVRGQLAGYNACFFCLGVSSVGMKAEQYYEITYTLTMHVAETLVALNPGMDFCYVSGAGTDRTEKGRVRWARVKGKTENGLAKLPFRHSYSFRPGFMKPTPGLIRTNPAYKYIGWLYPIGRALSPGRFVTLREVGLAMICVVSTDYAGEIIGGKDIIWLAAEEQAR